MKKNEMEMITFGFMIGAMVFGLFLGGTTKHFQAKYENTIPTNAHMEYINKDSLPDLVYPTGETYLQTKEGNFISYNEILQQEKSKLDSIYQAKQDSLKRVYENKLEKEVK